MATLTSAIDRQAMAFQINAGIYDGLLNTLLARQAWSLASGGDRMVQRHRAAERRQIHGQATRPAELGMAHLAAQSCPQYCCDGLVHRSDHQLRRPARFLNCG
jgi:hypothetical protein